MTRAIMTTAMAEQTCPKCGKQYYGIGCPYCDYPPVPPDPSLAQRTLIIGGAMLGVGLYVISRYFLISSSHRFEILAAGLLFTVAGFHCMAATRLYKEDGRLSALMGGLMLSGFAYLGLFAAFADGRVRGGIPFIPDSWNQHFGKFLFGVGGFGMAVWSLFAFYRAIKPKTKTDVTHTDDTH